MSLRAAQRRLAASTASRPTSSATAWPGSRRTGTTIKGTWKKASLTAPTRFYDATGKPVTLTVGQTFVQVMTHGYDGHDQGRHAAAAPAAATRGRRPGCSTRGSADLRVDPAASRAATSAQVRLAATARSRAASARPVVDPLVGPDRRASADGEPVRVARLDEDAGRRRRSPAARRPPTRRPACPRRSPRSRAGRRRPRRPAGRTARAPRTSAASALVVEARRVGEGIADVRRGPRPGRATRDRRATRRRAGPAAATGSSAGSVAGRPATASAASAPQQRAEVLARVVAARSTRGTAPAARGAPARREVDRVGAARVPLAGPDDAGERPGAARAARRGARSRRSVEEPARRARRPPRVPTMTAAASRNEARPEPLPEARRRASAGTRPAAPTARGRGASTTIGRPDAIGSGPPPTAW